MATARAWYESWRDGNVDWCEIEPPENRVTPEGVASYLRFGGRISDGTLMCFVWEEKLYGAMGQELPSSNAPNE